MTATSQPEAQGTLSRTRRTTRPAARRSWPWGRWASSTATSAPTRSSPCGGVSSPSTTWPLTEENVLGLLSLMVRSLILVISLKYLTFVMRADNDGEGGILALTTLAARALGDAPSRRKAQPPLVLIGLFGAALLYGDGVITPSKSVFGHAERG